VKREKIQGLFLYRVGEYVGWWKL